VGSVVQTLSYDLRRSTDVIPVATISVLRTSCDGHCFRPTSHSGEMHRLTHLVNVQVEIVLEGWKRLLFMFRN